MKELKYYVKCKFYANIENFEFRNDVLFSTRLTIPPCLPRYNLDPRPISIYELSILYYIRKNIDDLSLVDEMISRNEGISPSSSII